MKSNFVSRTGKGGGFNVADQVEKRLSLAELLPRKQIPRSTMNRLLSSEAFRNRVGFSVAKKRFQFTHDPQIVLAALQRIATDLAHRNIVLGDIWDVDGKRKYLDELEEEGVLPTAAHTIRADEEDDPTSPDPKPPTRPRPPRPPKRTNLIPRVDYALPWPGRLHRLRAIWEELQFDLTLDKHSNSISVLFRVLLEFAVDNYAQQENVGTIRANDNLARRTVCVAEDMRSKNKIDENYLRVVSKFRQFDSLFSASTLNLYVHSPQFAPSPDHLIAMWDTASELVVECLKV